MLFLDFIELLELCATTTSRKYVVKHLRELMHTHCVQPAASTAAAAQSIMRVVALLLPRLVFKAQLSIKTETLQAALQHIQACSTTTPLSLDEVYTRYAQAVQSLSNPAAKPIDFILPLFLNAGNEKERTYLQHLVCNQLRSNVTRNMLIDALDIGELTAASIEASLLTKEAPRKRQRVVEAQTASKGPTLLPFSPTKTVATFTDVEKIIRHWQRQHSSIPLMYFASQPPRLRAQLLHRGGGKWKIIAPNFQSLSHTIDIAIAPSIPPFLVEAFCESGGLCVVDVLFWNGSDLRLKNRIERNYQLENTVKPAMQQAGSCNIRVIEKNSLMLTACSEQRLIDLAKDSHAMGMPYLVLEVPQPGYSRLYLPTSRFIKPPKIVNLRIAEYISTPTTKPYIKLATEEGTVVARLPVARSFVKHLPLQRDANAQPSIAKPQLSAGPRSPQEILNRIQEKEKKECKKGQEHYVFAAGEAPVVMVEYAIMRKQHKLQQCRFRKLQERDMPITPLSQLT